MNVIWIMFYVEEGMLMELYVIRHGQTIVNVLELVNSRNSIGINIKGRIEAKKASEIIKNIKIDLIFCSPLRRTKQTCKIVNKNNVKVIYDDRLLEREVGNKHFRFASKIDIYKWYDPEENMIYKNTEGFKSILKRVEGILNEIKEKYPDKTILFVTHGDVCKALNAFLTNNFDIKSISEFEQGNCEIVKYLPEDLEKNLPTEEDINLHIDIKE